MDGGAGATEASRTISEARIVMADKPVTTGTDVADTLLEVVQQAREGTANPQQAIIACKAVSALIGLTRLQMDYNHRHAERISWLEGRAIPQNIDQVSDKREALVLIRSELDRDDLTPRRRADLVMKCNKLETEVMNQ
jgi:hypothetical protein